MSHLVASISLANYNMKLSAKESEISVGGLRKVVKILESSKDI